MKYSYNYKPPVVSVSCLGQLGYWGNCLFQYAAARKYAELHHAKLQTPSWNGEVVFNLKDDRITEHLQKCDIDVLPWGKTNVDIQGYFQFQDIIAKLSRKELKSWFTFQDRWLKRFPKKKPFYAACHLRQGDYSKFSHVYCLVPQQSYANKCKELGINDSDVIYIKQDEPEVAEDLKGLGVPSFASTGMLGQDLEFLPDFMTLVNADIILRANSTFSWWAAALSNAKIYSPLVEDKVGVHDVKFVEGNWPRMADTKNVGGAKVTDLHLRD